MPVNIAYKSGLSVVALLSNGSINGSVTRNNVTVTDLATNPAYTEITCTGSSPSSASIILPPIEGNYCVISNQCGAAITVKSYNTDPSPVTLSSTECALLICDGTKYIKTTQSTTSAMDISAYPLTMTAHDTDLFLVKSGGDAGVHDKMTLLTLKNYLGISASVTGTPIIISSKYVITGPTGVPYGVTLLTDGMYTSSGDRVLLAYPNAYSGVWIASGSGAWSRAPDMLAGASASGMVVATQGNAGNHGGSIWICQSTTGSDVVGTASLKWARVLTAGNGYPVYPGGLTEGGDIMCGNGNGTSFPNDGLPRLVNVSGYYLPYAAIDTGVTNGVIDSSSYTYKKPIANSALVPTLPSGGIIREVETRTNTAGVTEWTHHSGGSNAVKSGRVLLSGSGSFLPAGGTMVQTAFGEVTSQWRLHSGFVTITIITANGKVAMYRLGIVATYSGGRCMLFNNSNPFTVTAGAHGVSNIGTASDNSGTPLISGTLVMPLTGMQSPSDGPNNWASTDPPTFRISPYTVSSAYGISVDYGGFTGSPVVYDWHLEAEIVASKSGY